MRSCAKFFFPCGGRRAMRKNLPSARRWSTASVCPMSNPRPRKRRTFCIRSSLAKMSRSPASRRTAALRSAPLFCVYGEDDQEGALRLLTTVEHFRQELLMHGVIAKQFALDLSQKLSTLYYTDNTTPYFCAELVSVWKIPSVNRGGICMVKAKGQGRCEKRRLLYVHRAEHRRHDPAGAYSVR